MGYLDTIQKSKVVKGVYGKVIMVYGDNNLGKTKQFAKIGDNCAFMPFESNALNAIGGTNELPINSYGEWKAFTDTMHKSKVKLAKLKKKKRKLEARLASTDDGEKEQEYEERLEKLQERFNKNEYYSFSDQIDTIVLDTITALGKSVKNYILDQAGAKRMKDGEWGEYYKDLEDEFYKTWDRFLSLGFTTLVIAHEGQRTRGTEYDEEADKEVEIKQIYPKGDEKRIIKPIIDRCDIVIYLKSNGVDADGNVIPSSAYLAETDDFFARTKWDNMQTVIPVYSYEALVDVINEAIEEQEEQGIDTITHEQEMAEEEKELEVDVEELKDEIIDMAKLILDLDDGDWDGKHIAEYIDIVEDALGKDKAVKDAKPNQIPHLQVIKKKVAALCDDFDIELE